MKYFFFITFIFSLLLFACEEELLEQNPSHKQLSSEVLTDLASLKAALTGCYDGFQDVSYYGRNFYVLADLYADNTKISSNSTGTFNSIYNLSILPSDDFIYNLWLTGYKIINRANNIIHSAEILEEGSEIERNQLIGEAKAIRALVYYDLLRCFSHTTTIDPSSGIDGANSDGGHAGIPSMLDMITIDSIPTPKRATNREIVDIIISDLKSADTLITMEPSSPYTISKHAIKFLISKGYLLRGKYAVAYTYANLVVKSGLFSLVSNSNYVESWESEFTTESIFSISMTSGDYNNTNSLGYLYSSSGYNGIVPTENYANLYGNENDVRKDLFVSGSEILKYPGRNNIVGVENIPVLRYSDVLLTKAELACRLYMSGTFQINYLDTARYTLDLIRKRANPDAIASFEEGDDLLNKILLERRKELAFEGDRFFTIKRTKSDIMRTDCNTAKCELLFPDDRFAFPIPQNEINANDSITQNPGY